MLTLVGNRPEWALTMLACFRQGFVVLPCTEQLRPKDLAQRLAVAQPRLVVADIRNAATLTAAGWSGDTLWVPFEAETSHTPPPAELGRERSLPDHVHLRHRGRAEGRRCTASATSAASNCRPSTGSRRNPGELVWCTAAAGWSKSARNAFIAPWLRGAAALLHDARFDPHERLELIDPRARRRALHGADRVPRDRQARDAAPAPDRSRASSPPARR